MVKHIESHSYQEHLDPLFEASTGIAMNATAEAEAKKAVIKALNLAQERLGTIVAGEHGDCIVEIRGIGGSYTKGKQHLGINPKNISYDDLRNMEGSKAHTPEGQLIQSTGYLYPSDIDISLTFKRKDGSQRTIGDEVALSKEVHKVLAGIYDETGVFISAHDSDLMSVKDIKEVIDGLKS